MSFGFRERNKRGPYPTTFIVHKESSAPNIKELQSFALKSKHIPSPYGEVVAQAAEDCKGFLFEFFNEGGIAYQHGPRPCIFTPFTGLEMTDEYRTSLSNSNYSFFQNKLVTFVQRGLILPEVNEETHFMYTPDSFEFDQSQGTDFPLQQEAILARTGWAKKIMYHEATQILNDLIPFVGFRQENYIQTLLGTSQPQYQTHPRDLTHIIFRTYRDETPMFDRKEF